MKFAISGFGRSGSAFLAQLMDRSPTWTVYHEPSSEYDRHALCRRFAEYPARVGEVNSYALACLWDLPVDRRGCLIRDPLAIAVSAANKGHILSSGFIDHLAQSLALIDSAIGRGALPVSFERMTTDLGYLTGICHTFGVTDVVPTKEDLANKVNASERRELPSWECLDRETRGRIERPVRWFRHRYHELGAMRVIE